MEEEEEVFSLDFLFVHLGLFRPLVPRVVLDEDF